MTEQAQLTLFQQQVQEMQQGEMTEQDFWPVFLNAEFYIPIRKIEDSVVEKDFAFIVYDSKQVAGGKTVLISDSPEYLKGTGATDLMMMKGGQIVELVYPDVEISFAFVGGGFGIPAQFVKQLKDAITSKTE
ncbi:hypothetical protein HR060_13240 [Catenovulum sp. SM1970]|uniref:hypothetical protein n=1 Tax=Marinifaba aquimaris TaxID=2741323 RepID=UPI00157172B1|nr:hypothetical protein [Marinifaba aquimaris]NTS77819.1 hypothetical protein [Marinifaba aquimaris]